MLTCVCLLYWLQSLLNIAVTPGISWQVVEGALSSEYLYVHFYRIFFHAKDIPLSHAFLEGGVGWKIISTSSLEICSGSQSTYLLWV